jgi:restriction system protein
LARWQREADRQRAANIRAQQARARAAAKAQRDYERAQVASEKERQRLYVETQLDEVDEDNEDLEDRIEQLGSLLADSLGWNHVIDFATLRQEYQPPTFDPGELGVTEGSPDPMQFQPQEPTGFSRHLSHAKKQYLAEQERGRDLYDSALAAHAEREQRRVSQREEARKAHEAAQVGEEARVRADNAKIDALEQAYLAGKAEGVIDYVIFVLDRTYYPEDFPRENRLAYVPESKQLVIELDLPPFSVVPEVGLFRYVKSSDKRTETKRPESQRRTLYASVVAQITLRTLYEVFSSDVAGHIDTVVLNAYVNSVDRGTGHAVHPCLVTLRVTSDAFEQLDLSQVDPLACLKALGAGVSKSPAELVPVRPMVDFSMVDPRFVEEQDILSGLDERPNLMELTPSEFESLITNLFEKMGLQTKLTQASRDGGIDCVAYDPRPVLGGKVVIQAKRYKNTVGVSAVRDLFGAMHNEGATKGILVTTSGYGKASFDFASNKPLALTIHEKAEISGEAMNRVA